MSLSEKYESAQRLVEEHNQAIGKDQPGFVNPVLFIQNLKAAGGTSEERLKNLSWDEIQSLFGLDDTKIKPFALAKGLANIFRETQNSQQIRPASAKKADKMTLRELIENYDPEDYNAVAKRLAEVGRGEPCIVFRGNLI